MSNTGYSRGVVGDRWVRVDLSKQLLELYDGPRVVARYAVSTAAKGPGEHAGSEQTPRGAHEVAELIGDGAPLGAVFAAREPTGEILTPQLHAANPDRDWILTRVVWLSGLEEGRNRSGDCDSHDRYIYIHGTPDDQPMGEPRSHGCIRMRNEEVIELFAQLERGVRVLIEE